MADDQPTAMAEISQAIAGDILSSPDLNDPGWDTLSMVAEVSDARTAVTAYRYTTSGSPVPTRGPENLDLFLDLWQHTKGANGETWDVVVVKIHRDTANLVMDFFSGAEADRWRVNPGNIAHLPESLRPRPEDFEAVGQEGEPGGNGPMALTGRRFRAVQRSPPRP